jgi:hypothetical protein
MDYLDGLGERHWIGGRAFRALQFVVHLPFESLQDWQLLRQLLEVDACGVRVNDGGHGAAARYGVKVKERLAYVEQEPGTEGNGNGLVGHNAPSVS